MSAPVDVLAVMDRAVTDQLPLMSAVDMKEARAAVAELIEAANGLLDVTGRGKVCTVTESLAAYRRVEAAIAASTGCNCPAGANPAPKLHAPNCPARAALARVGGAE